MKIAHQLDIFIGRFDLQARVVSALLAYGADRIALIVMRWIDLGRVGESQKPIEDRLILRPGVAVLEVGAAGAADQQRIAGEHAI